MYLSGWGAPGVGLIDGVVWGLIKDRLGRDGIQDAAERSAKVRTAGSSKIRVTATGRRTGETTRVSSVR